MLSLEKLNMPRACCPTSCRSVLEMLNRFGKAEGVTALSATSPTRWQHLNGRDRPISSVLERKKGRLALPLLPYRV